MKIAVGRVPELLKELGMTEEEVRELLDRVTEKIEKLGAIEESEEVKVSPGEMIVTEFPVDKAIVVLEFAGIDPNSFNSVLEAKAKALAVLYQTFFGLTGE
jgi:helix-turn-helix protein